MGIATSNDLDDAAMALRNWFRSQDIDPYEALMIMEYFIARMILQNGKGAADIEKKINLIDTSIRRIIAEFQKATP
jgi:hypothetical protein